MFLQKLLPTEKKVRILDHNNLLSIKAETDRAKPKTKDNWHYRTANANVFYSQLYQSYSQGHCYQNSPIAKKAPPSRQGLYTIMNYNPLDQSQGMPVCVIL